MENNIQSTQPNTHAAEPEQTIENQYTETMNTETMHAETMHAENKYIEQMTQYQQNAQQRNAYAVGDTEVCYTKEPSAGLPQTVSPTSPVSPASPVSSESPVSREAPVSPVSSEPPVSLQAPQEPQAPQTPSPSVRVAIVPVASRLELALEDAKKYPKRCTRWYYREELVNKAALETMLDEYHSVKLLAIALNCSEHMVYRAIRHHGITYPRAYPSVKAKELLQL